jgi:hypothetical protein
MAKGKQPNDSPQMIVDLTNALPGRFIEVKSPITVDQGRDFGEEYYTTRDRLPIVSETGKYIKAFNIDVDVIDALKAHIGTTNFLGIRVYFGVKGRNATTKEPYYTLIIVGRKKVANGEEDHLKDGEIYDYVLPCPENCPASGAILH